MPCSLLRPRPHYLRAKLLNRVILPPLHVPSAGRSSRFAVLQFLQRVIFIENWSWPFSLISDGFLRPVILHVILPCSLAAGGRSMAARLPAMFCKMATCTWTTTLPSFSTATACRSKEFSSSTAQQSFVDLSTRIRGRGGEAKTRVLVVTPPPPSFSWSQKGGA